MLSLYPSYICLSASDIVFDRDIAYAVIFALLASYGFTAASASAEI